MESLAVEFDHLAGKVIIRVVGKVDLLSSPGLAKRLSDMHQDGSATPGEVVLDLTGVTFLDSSGIAALMVFALACANRGATLRVVPTPMIRRSFVITGLTEVMGMDDPGDDGMLSGTDESSADT